MQKDKKLGRSVVRLFGAIDRKIASFKKITGIECIPCAGGCCKSEFIEVTELDVLPAVLELIESGKIDEVLKQLEKKNVGCVFYSKKPTKISGCHCKIYPLRPTVCRLFGFGTMKMKDGELKLVTCKKQKKRFARAIKEAEAKKKIINTLPNHSTISMRLYSIDPLLGSLKMHINNAIKRVAERILLILSLA